MRRMMAMMIGLALLGGARAAEPPVALPAVFDAELARKTGADDYRNRARRAEYWDAMHDMFEKTDTKQAPWKVIDNNNRKAGRIAALTYVAERLEKLVPMDFPAPDPEVVKLAREAFGYKPAK